MLIQVIFSGNRYDYVKDFMLDNLIEAKDIVKFRRGTEWVTIGVDPIRERKHAASYNGSERRGAKALGRSPLPGGS